MIEVEHCAQSGPTFYGTRRSAIVARRHCRTDELTTEPLVKPFFIVMCAELPKQDAKVSLSENDEMIETLGANGPHESFSVGVGTYCQVHLIRAQRRKHSE